MKAILKVCIGSVAFGIILAAFSIFVAFDTILVRFFSWDARANTKQNQLPFIRLILFSYQQKMG
jgi:hypothetical protein